MKPGSSVGSGIFILTIVPGFTYVVCSLKLKEVVIFNHLFVVLVVPVQMLKERIVRFL